MYSGKEITKAGKFLADGDLQDNDKFKACFDILVYWRSTYSEPLETAYHLLQKIVIPIEKNALFAKRLKRYVSIVVKLRRFENTTLRTMQDLGGCRAIVSSEKKVRKVVRRLKSHEAFKFNDRRFRYKDYISNPKEDGYRSYHIIGLFKNADGLEKRIEIQIRTLLQHYWATALEIIDLFTDQSLKTNEGKKEWSRFFFQVGELFALLDGIPNIHTLEHHQRLQHFFKKANNSKDDIGDLLGELARSERKLNITTRFSRYANSLKIIDDDIKDYPEAGYVLIVIDHNKEELTYSIISQNDSEKANKRYAEAENEAADPKNNWVVALVYSSSLGSIKEAYPNFFADSSKFMEFLSFLLECEKHVQRSVISRIFGGMGKL